MSPFMKNLKSFIRGITFGSKPEPLSDRCWKCGELLGKDRVVTLGRSFHPEHVPTNSVFASGGGYRGNGVKAKGGVTQ